MEYFKEGRTEKGYEIDGILLGDNVFSISAANGKIVFREECDGYFVEELTKEEAIEMLKEAIEWRETWVSSENTITLRNYFAAKAMAGLLASGKTNQSDKDRIAEWSYQMADAMLKELAQKDGE